MADIFNLSVGKQVSYNEAFSTVIENIQRESFGYREFIIMLLLFINLSYIAFIDIKYICLYINVNIHAHIKHCGAGW